MNKEFVDKHTNFRRGNTDIGYGLRPDHPLEVKAKNNDKAGGSVPISFDEYAKLVSDYTLDYAHKISGVPKDKLVEMAGIYADPKIKVISIWTMGVNRHTRGV